MILGGLQKLSFIDYPEHICAVIFTQGCMFRCSYCHNPDLIEIKEESPIEVQKILEYLRSRKNFLDGVCITGGEPTLQSDLPQFIKTLKSYGLKVKLDTSGINPDMIEELVACNLVDYMAMDIKHVWEKYNLIVKTASSRVIENCKKTFDIIQYSGMDHEFRTTVFSGAHTEDDFFKITSYLVSGEKYFLQRMRFIKTLDPSLKEKKAGNAIDAVKLSQKLQEQFPHLIISVR